MIDQSVTFCHISTIFSIVIYVVCMYVGRAFESHNAIWRPPWQLAREAVLAEEHCRLLGAVVRLVGDGVVEDVVHLHVVAVVVLVPVLQADPSVGTSLKSKTCRLRDIVQLRTRWSKSHFGLRRFFGPDCCILDDRKSWARPCCYQSPVGLIRARRRRCHWGHWGCGHW